MFSSVQKQAMNATTCIRILKHWNYSSFVVTSTWSLACLAYSHRICRYQENRCSCIWVQLSDS